MSDKASVDLLKILCIHGYRQTGKTFREKTGSLRKALKKHAEFVYIDAPNVIKSTSDEGAATNEERGWWFSDTEGGFRAAQETDVNPGYNESVETIAQALKEHGPFDGVLAFSQGAAMLALICGLKQEGDTRFPFNFAILVAGFRSLSSGHDQCFREKITCPTLHVFGDTDQVIPKGHYVPATSAEKKVYIPFLQEQVRKKKEHSDLTS